MWGKLEDLFQNAEEKGDTMKNNRHRFYAE